MSLTTGMIRPAAAVDGHRRLTPANYLTDETEPPNLTANGLLVRLRVCAGLSDPSGPPTLTDSR
jgi:hypothetical protein